MAKRRQKVKFKDKVEKRQEARSLKNSQPRLTGVKATNKCKMVGYRETMESSKPVLRNEENRAEL